MAVRVEHRKRNGGGEANNVSTRKTDNVIEQFQVRECLRSRVERVPKQKQKQ